MFCLLLIKSPNYTGLGLGLGLGLTVLWSLMIIGHPWMLVVTKPLFFHFSHTFNFRFALYRIRTLENLGQLNAEEDIGCLAAAVCLDRSPASSCLKIVPVDGVILVSFRRDDNDATWRWTPQLVQQQVRQVEMTCIIQTRIRSFN